MPIKEGISTKPTIEDLAKRVYGVCLAKRDSNRPQVIGDMDFFDQSSIEVYREYIVAILNDTDIPQGAKAVHNPIVEMGLAIGELTCEIKPSSWYYGHSQGIHSVITRVSHDDTKSNQRVVVK